MIIEAREDVVRMEGSLDKNLWPTIQAAANLLLRHHVRGIIIDGSGLTHCSADGAETFRDAMNYIERYQARIVVCSLPEEVTDVVRTVPGVRSRLPVAASLEEARASLSLARGSSVATAGGRVLQDILVPLLRAGGSEPAASLACRLARAGGQKARVHLAYMLEVPRHLPLTAPLPEEEANAAQLLHSAEATVHKEGMIAVPHVRRAREAAEEIVEQAGELGVTLIVLAAVPSVDPGDDFLPRLVKSVLERAPCEVVLNKPRV